MKMCIGLRAVSRLTHKLKMKEILKNPQVN